MAKNLTPQTADFAKWYVDVIREAGLAEYGPVKGTMIIKPYGYAIWERMQALLDVEFKTVGVKNAYFPSLIPKSYLEREKEHVEGFSPELAVVTHAGGEELAEPVVVRPTSETIVHDSFSKWISSYRDLPMKINQWANVVRWELRTRLFLRTSEFLWQEGHCAFATDKEAQENMLQMLGIYKKFMEDVLAVPIVDGTKTATEKFAGAVTSTSCEGLMKSGVALQMGTSHNLGQNFSKVFDVKFLNDKGKSEYAWLTSWGVSTRLVGAVIMAHGDDRGLVLPPEIAPVQAVIVPIYKSDEERSNVLKAAEKIVKDSDARIEIDDRDAHSPGYKFTEWEIKGVPVRIEIGPRDLTSGECVLVSRLDGKKQSIKLTAATKMIEKELVSLQKQLYVTALNYRQAHTATAKDKEEFKKAIEAGGFVIADWCGEASCEKELKTDTGATIRVIPFEKPSGKPNLCVNCVREAKEKVYFAKAY